MNVLQNIVITISLLLLTATIVTANYNQVYADRVNLRGFEGQVICPDSNASFDIEFQIALRPNIGWWEIQSRSMPIGGTVTSESLPDIKVMDISSTTGRILEEVQKQFVIETVMDVDNLCNSDVPSDITIRGPCIDNGIVSFKAKNGLEAEGIIDAHESGGCVQDPTSNSSNPNP